MFTKVLLCQLAVIAVARNMRRECLSLTKATGRLSNEEPSFDTEEDFEFYTNLSEDFSVQIIEVCYGNGRGNLKGF